MPSSSAHRQGQGQEARACTAQPVPVGPQGHCWPWGVVVVQWMQCMLRHMLGRFAVEQAGAAPRAAEGRRPWALQADVACTPGHTHPAHARAAEHSLAVAGTLAEGTLAADHEAGRRHAALQKVARGVRWVRRGAHQRSHRTTAAHQRTLSPSHSFFFFFEFPDDRVSITTDGRRTMKGRLRFFSVWSV